MPYRDGMLGVLQRCEELRLRIERIEECAVEAPDVHTVAQALAWEASLQTRLDHLAVRRRESDAMVSVGVGSGALPEPPPRELANVPIAVIIVLSVSSALLVGVAYFAGRDAPAKAPPPPRSELLAGNVTSPVHHGDRCTVAIDDYDIDVICPTVERRFRLPGDPREGAWVQAMIPGKLDVDRRSRSLTMTDENDRVMRIELDAWR